MNAIMHRMDWDDLRFFYAIACAGSIRGAASKMRVNHSTVLRRISAFEEKIGVRLFDRLPTGYVLTPAGEEMVSSAQRIEEEVATLDRHVFGQDAQLSGNLRITIPANLSTYIMMPILASFSETYPGVELEVDISWDTRNLTKREADVAIRITNKPPEHLIGRRVIRYAKATYASLDYLSNHDPIGNPAALNWIGWDENVPFPWWVKDSDYPTTPVRHQILDPMVQIEAAKAGMGLTMLPCFMADQEPTLRRLPPGRTQTSFEIWILTHADLLNTVRVRTFTSFIAEALTKQSDLLEGKCPQV